MKDKTKKILLVIGGGISAYKSLDLLRLLKKNNFEIKTILTKSGKEFVTPLSITSLVGKKPYNNLFDLNNESEIDHISLSRWADLILVVPATANFLSKLSTGRAEDLATTAILASNKMVYLAPAMNVRMWDHKATQVNFKTLVGYGYKFIGPTIGEMACGEYGKGKMASPKEIYSEIKKFFQNKDKFKHKKIKAIVTTGPTREYIDPVRYISNESSGKQGYEIAFALSRLGVNTTLITGPANIDSTKNIKIHRVTTADEMFKVVKKCLPADIVVCAAAVSDFKPGVQLKSKIKKDSNKIKNLTLEKNIDILEYLGKSNRYKPKILVGFSAETERLIKNSQIKLKRKHCDIILANDVSKQDFGFNKDYNEIYYLEKNGKSEKIRKNKKSFIASIIAEKIINKLLINDKSFN